MYCRELMKWAKLRIHSFSLHLVNIPVHIQQHQVNHPHIGSDPFHFLGIPKRKGIIVPIGKQNGIGSTEFR